jgi:hypothetical protein
MRRIEMKHLFETVRRILINPKEALEKHLERETTITDLYREYILLLCIIPAGATLLCLLGIPGAASFGSSLILTALIYVFFAGGVWLNGYLMQLIAPRFGTEIEQITAIKISALIWTPFFVASVLFILPNFSPFTFLAVLYGIYIFYLAAQKVVQADRDKKTAYIIIISLSMVLIWLIGYWIYRIGL